jgi:hypothetical protein
MEQQGHVVEGGRGGKARFWRRQLAALARDGGTQLRFCERNGLSRDQLQYWKRKLAGPHGELSLVEVPATAVLLAQRAVTEPPVVTVIVGQRYRVEVGAEFEATALSRVLDVLESRR